MLEAEIGNPPEWAAHSPLPTLRRVQMRANSASQSGGWRANIAACQIKKIQEGSHVVQQA